MQLQLSKHQLLEYNQENNKTRLTCREALLLLHMVCSTAMIEPALPCIVQLQLQPKLLQLRHQLLQLQRAHAVCAVNMQRLLWGVAASCKRPASRHQPNSKQPVLACLLDVICSTECARQPDGSCGKELERIRVLVAGRVAITEHRRTVLRLVKA